MDALDILHYGDREVTGAFEGLKGEAWNHIGVTRRWSPKDLLAHLASYEIVLGEIMESVLGRGATPALDRFTKQHASFNDAEVAARRPRSPEEIRAEYAAAHQRVMALARELGAERMREVGTIPW